MTDCYLCGSQAEIYGQDYGRRKAVRCTSCNYYEITNAALSKIQTADFPREAKDQLAKQVKQVSKSGAEPVIIFEDEAVKVFIKPN